MTSLFSLTEQYRSLMVLAESETDIPEDVLRDTVEALTGELEVKAQNVARFCLNQEAMAEAIENAAEQMQARAKRLRGRTAYLKQYLLTNMQAAGMTKVESPEIVLSIRNNPESVVVFDEKALPADLMVQPPAPPPRPDKLRIKDLLKAGQDVAGARLERTQRLSITP